MTDTSDLSQRFPQNPLVRPADLKPSRPDWQVECLLNPGVFRFKGKTCLLVRVAERPLPRETYVYFPFSPNPVRRRHWGLTGKIRVELLRRSVGTAEAGRSRW